VSERDKEIEIEVEMDEEKKGTVDKKKASNMISY